MKILILLVVEDLIKINISSSRELNKHNINYNLAYYITKLNIINVIDKLILLQRKIKAYLCLKKAINNYYNNSNCPYINKVNINKMFYITKEKSNENECLEKVKKIQKLYKKRYLYMKNNIINDVNSNDDKLILSKNGSFNIFPNYNGAVRSSKKKSNNNNDFTKVKSIYMVLKIIKSPKNKKIKDYPIKCNYK